MTETVPNSLLAQLLMTTHGPYIESQIENGIIDSDLVIYQRFRLLYNFHSKAPKDTGSRQKHS
jgi:hypothetical protein